jgi:hypothetical protein
MSRTFLALLCAGLAWLTALPLAQLNDGDLIDHPAIEYRRKPTADPISALKPRLDSGAVRLTLDGQSGHLRSLLQALDIPLSSQILVFSQSSVQGARINAGNPRALYFNDSVVVGWVRGGFIEVASQDPEQGTVFYTVDSRLLGGAVINRRDECLSCHHTYRTGLVAGVIEPMGQTRPLENRWGGWYVTGNLGSIRHLGNVDMATVLKDPTTVNTTPLASLEKQFDVTGYLTPHSDIAALMVFEHQMQMMNLLTRLGWETRAAAHEHRLEAARASLEARASEVVDYLLFVEEAPIASPLVGTSGFAQTFSAGGPRDSKGRSLRQLDLTKRLLRYPCSYMIYSAQFERLPQAAKSAVYARVWAILSGAERDSKYRHLTVADRQAIIEILRETKSDLPAIFKG